MKDFQLIALPIAKDKETGRKRVELKAFFDQHGQPVNRLTQIRRSAGEVNSLNADFT
nr:hypothetical protein [Acididesulfobacillus acetoxydans]